MTVDKEMDLKRELDLHLTRRQLFGRLSTGIGGAALAALLKNDLFAQEPARDTKTGASSGCRISRRRPSASSFSINRAGRRNSISSITNPD